MKRRYAFQPEEYEIGEIERTYADMARRGWILEKRGGYLSRYRREEPQQLKYRVELSSPSFLDDGGGLPDEQIALYEECGWKYVTSAGRVNIFCAPENSDAPEFYTDPRQQAATLKSLRRSYLRGWIAVALIFGFSFLMGLAMANGTVEALDDVWAEVRMAWVRATAVLLIWLTLLAHGCYQMLRGTVCTQLLYRRLKSGKPIDHSPRRPVAHRAITWAFNGLLVVFVLLSVVQLCGTHKYEMPQKADGPYLLLRDVGWDGERTMNYLEKPSTVETSRSLAAEQWNTYECVSDGTGNDVWMYQDIYRMDSHEQAMALVPVLMRDALFARGPDGFRTAEVPGLDAAWRAGLEQIGVSGDMVWFITYSDPGLYGPEQELQADPLAALARMLQQEERGESST